MPSLSYERLIRNLVENETVMPRADRVRILAEFLEHFSLPDLLKDKLLADFDGWHYHHLNTNEHFLEEQPHNNIFKEQYSIQTLNLPDHIHAYAEYCGHVVTFHAVTVCPYPESDFQIIPFNLAGADSFSRLADGTYIISGQGRQAVHVPSDLFLLKDGAIRQVIVSADAAASLQAAGITNFYGFVQIGDKLYFGTWGEQANARLMRAELIDHTFCHLQDITPEAIRQKGYDDLFVMGDEGGWLKIGVKPGPETITPALYYFHPESGEVKAIDLLIDEDIKELITHPQLTGTKDHHLYFHQFYKLDRGCLAVLIYDRHSSLLQILDTAGKIILKYYLALPNDHIPFADYGWNHLLKHSSSPFLYVPDNTGIIHRFQFDSAKKTLHVLRFRLPFHGEITALSATTFGCYIAVTCNHSLLVVKLTQDLKCFLIHKSEEGSTPITGLREESDSLVIALTGSRFYPSYLFSRYCHYLHPRPQPGQSEVMFIHTKPLQDDLLLFQRQERQQLKWTIARKIHHYPNYQHLVQLAKFEFEDQQYDRAVAYAQQAILLEETALVPFKILGFALLHCNRFEEAKGSFERYLAEDPQDRETQQALQHCRQIIGDSIRHD